MKIAIDKIETDHNPRSTFEIDEVFVESIKRLGLIQPITVQKKGEKFVLLDGERRYRACKKLGLTEIDAEVKEYDEQQQREVPLITDLCKDLLPLGDKAVAVAQLVSKDKKYSVEGIAKMLCLKKKGIEQLIKIAGVHPKVKEAINKGTIALDDAENIAEIGKEEVQIKVAEAVAKGDNFIEAIQKYAFILPFDDVFTYEQAKKDKQIGICIKTDYDEDLVLTYDKKYYDAKQKEYEAREKKQYSEAQEKHDKAQKAHDSKEAEGKAERKRDFKKAKSEQQKTYGVLKDAIVKHIAGKPTKDDIERQLNIFVRQISQDTCKAILKGFGVEFKASDMQSEDFKKLTARVLLPLIKGSDELVNLIYFAQESQVAQGATMWDMSGVKKLIAKIAR